MNSDIISIISLLCLFVIAGGGIYVLSRLCGQISVLAGPYIATSAILCAYLSSEAPRGMGTSFVVAFPIAVVTTTLISVVLGVLTYRLSGASNIIASLALSSGILYCIVQSPFVSKHVTIFSDISKLQIGGNDFKNLTAFGHSFSSETGILIFVLFIALAIMFYLRNFSRSPLARSMRSLGQGEKFAQLNAISPVSTKVCAHLLSGICFAVAGALMPYVIDSLKLSTNNIWLGSFGLLTSISIVLVVFVSNTKQFWLICLTTVVIYGAFLLAAHYTDLIDNFASTGGSKFGAIEAICIFGALCVIALSLFNARLARNKL